MRRRCGIAVFVLAVSGLAATACVESPDLDADSALVLAHDFPTLSLGAGEERNFICQSWTLHNDAPLYVNAVSMAGGPGWHHSNWLYAAETDFAGPDDTWNCADRGFELVEAGISGGVLFTPSPELDSAVEQFGPGVAVVIPPHSKIIAEIHLLNVSEAALTTSAHLELDMLPVDEATVLLSPLALSYYALQLPPASRSEFTASCDFATAKGSSLDFRVHYVAPHYHALGQGMRIESYDRDGQTRMMYEVDRSIGEPLGYAMPVPFDLTGAEGIRFSCRYDNPLPETVGFGPSAADEMCVLFAFTDSPLRWIGGVLRDNENTPIEGTDPDMQRFSSPCQVLPLSQ